MLTADEVTVDADTPQIPVGIDGETVMAHTRPLHHPPPGTSRCRAQGTAWRSRPQAGPGMAAVAATRVLPHPGRSRAGPRPASQGAKPASTVEGGRPSQPPAQWQAPHAGGGPAGLVQNHLIEAGALGHGTASLHRRRLVRRTHAEALRAVATPRVGTMRAGGPPPADRVTMAWPPVPWPALAPRFPRRGRAGSQG